MHIQRAKGLLGETDMPIAMVAVASGFKYQRHLSQAFRKATGLTPNRYRRQHRADRGAAGLPQHVTFQSGDTLRRVRTKRA